MWLALQFGFLFRFWKSSKSSGNSTSYISQTHNRNTIAKFSNLGEILSSSIMNSVQTIIMIGGFVVLFSVIVSILIQSHVLDIFCFILEPAFSKLGIDIEFLPGLFTGILELTNGTRQIASIPCQAISINVILCSFLLGFGGISVLLQVFSITSKSDVSILPYFIGKILHGLFAALYTYFLLTYTSFFNLDLVPTFSSYNSQIPTSNTYQFMFIASLLLFVVLFIKRVQKKSVNR